MKRLSFASFAVVLLLVLASPDLNAGAVRAAATGTKASATFAATRVAAGTRAFAGQFGSHLRLDGQGKPIVNPRTRKREVDNGSLGFPFRRLVGQFGRTRLYDPGSGEPVLFASGRQMYDNGSTRVVLRSVAKGTWFTAKKTRQGTWAAAKGIWAAAW